MLHRSPVVASCLDHDSDGVQVRSSAGLTLAQGNVSGSLVEISFARNKLLAQGNVLASLVEISLNQFCPKTRSLAQGNVLAPLVQISLSQFYKKMVKVESTSF